MKMMRHNKINKAITLVALLAVWALPSAAQQLYDSLINISGTNFPQEKIHLHLDKAYYNPGETIWFKAYLIEKNNPSQISKTLYAELINEGGAVLQRKTMPILQSGAASFFELDTAVNSKLYIRAYTSWMLNFDSTLLYTKPITILNKKADLKKTNPVFTLTLFAEGGDLVENINCRVAFKTNNQEGIPFAVAGSVVDSKGKKISSFSSVHDGMGFFTFTPMAGEQYKAVWKSPDGQQHETPLPDAKQQGLALRVVQSGGKLTYTLNRPENADESFKSFIVFAQMHQQTVYAAKINMHQKTQVSADIITDSLPDGIVQLTIFNAAQIPVAERIAFINNGNYYFNTDLHAAVKNIIPHGKNVLQVDVGGDYLSNLSVSVTDAGLDADVANKENIFSELLLSSDVKGYVYNPAYYFSGDADSVKEHLDLVMMTNGWRRFKWEDLLAGRWPAISHKPDNYISITGSVYGLPKVQLKNKSLTAILKTGAAGTSFLSIPLNDDGRFNVSGMYFFDTARLYYQFNNDKEKKLTSSASYSFDNGLEKRGPSAMELFSSLYFTAPPDPAVVQKNIRQHNFLLSAETMQKTKTLQAVTVKSRQKPLAQQQDEKYTSGLFSGGFARVFDVENDPLAQTSQSVLDYLQGRVAGLQISTSGQGSITRRGSNTDVFLNEMQADIELLQSTSMHDVALIKVFDPPFFGAAGGGAGGAVAVYTKKGASKTDVKGLNEVKLFGYSALKEFYMPDYEKTPDANTVDYRTTLYWNPFILMDTKNRRVNIPFYNSDNCKKIKVVIEGLNENGQLTREEKVFE